jgi:hypothetical protein
MYLKFKWIGIFKKVFKKVLAVTLAAPIFALQLQKMERWSRG